MAFVLTYNSGVLQLQNYFERTTDDEFNAAIPTFFTFALNEISADLKNLGLGLYGNFNYNVGSPLIQKPGDWRSTISLTYTDALGNRIVLEKRLYEYARFFWPNETLTGPPKYYSDYDFNNYCITPTPPESYNGQLSYFATLLPLDTVRQTNWATQYAPQLLYNKLMKWGAKFCRQDDRVQLFEADSQACLQSLETENVVRKFDRTSKGDLA